MTLRVETPKGESGAGLKDARNNSLIVSYCFQVKPISAPLNEKEQPH